MVRGRGFGRGSNSSRGGSYRGSGSNTNYRNGSGRNSDFSSGSYGSSRGHYTSSNYGYDSRAKDRSFSSRIDRHEDHKRSYRTSSRDRSPDRKKSRHEDSRLSSSYSSSYRRNESSSSRRTPPPPTSSRSSSSYRSHREEPSHRHSSTSEPMGPPKSVPPRSTRIIRSRGTVTNRTRGSTSRGVRIIRRRETTDVRVMRRQLLLARQRDRARRIKIAKLTSSLRKTRDAVTHRPRKRNEKKEDEGVQRCEDDDKPKKILKADDSTEKADDSEQSKKESKTGEDSDEDDDAENELVKCKDKTDSRIKSPKSRKIKSFIKLTCVHCRMKCVTFKDYSNHLYSRPHKVAMRRLALRQKSQLAQMRMKQRNAQRDIEENSKEEIEDCEPQFCLLCRLNYRQPKAKHQLSEAHRNMKKFLMPYCNVCLIPFKSPMMYEAHRCSLEHIKRKARNDSHSDASGDEKEVDLNNFLTVDSVGEIDGNLDEDEHKPDEGNEKVNVGIEHVKKTSAFYCELCHIYFACKEDDEEIVKRHCSGRSHLKAFIRYKNDQNLRVEAERVQRRQKDPKEKKREGSDKNCAKEKQNDKLEDNEEAGEDKLWEDVDKDLGDLLREVGPEEQDDEEDGSVLNINIERFERFNGTEGDEENDKTEGSAEPKTSSMRTKKDSEENKSKKDTEEKFSVEGK